MLLCFFYLTCLFCAIQEIEKSDAQAEELRKKMRSKAKGRAPSKAGGRQAPKNQRKDNKKKANNVDSVNETISTSTTSAMEIGKPGVILFL